MLDVTKKVEAKKRWREEADRCHGRVMVVSGLTGGVLGAIFAEKAGVGFSFGLMSFIPAAIVNNAIDWASEKIHDYRGWQPK